VAHRSLLIFRRRLFTILSAISLLVCVATIVLWVRSYWRLDFWQYNGLNTFCSAQSTLGSLSFYRCPTIRGAVHWEHWSGRPETNPNGFQFSFNRSFIAFDFPHFIPVLLFAIPPALWVNLHAQSDRHAGERDLAIELLSGIEPA
jgi:hypothetical protein